MELSIIVLNYNGRQWLGECFRSIFENTRGISFEVILVDNASNDGSVDYARKEFPQVRVIESKTNLGFTRGNNLGVREAKGEYICILNNDTVIFPDAFNNLFSFLKSQSKRAIVTGKILTFDGSVQPNCSRFPGFFQEYLNFTFSKIKGPNPFTLKIRDDITQQVDVVTGTFFMIKREDMLELCGFDENIVIFYEDADLCLRFKKMGGQALYYPNSVIKHYWGGYYRSCNLKAIKISYKSIKYYFRKHNGVFYELLFNLSVKATALFFVILFGISGVVTFLCFKKIVEKFKMFLVILTA